MPALGGDGCKQLLWMRLTNPAWRDPCTAEVSRHLPMNVADVGGARDIPDLFPILKHHGVTAVVQAMEDLEDLCG